jgi:3',5'-cyclic AMP phosphodiesterase CpdA
VVEHDVDLVIHGGDLVEMPNEADIRRSLEQLVAVDRPLLVALGNHDLAAEDAAETWHDVLRDFPQITLADAHLPFDECDIYALNNHWTDGTGPGMYWDPVPPYRHKPCLHGTQLEWLDAKLAKHTDRPAIVVVHTQLDPVPPNAPNLDEYVPQSYPIGLNSVLDRHPHCRLVLSGHCHVTYAVANDMRVHLTTAAFGEVPFHIRLIDVRDRSISVETMPMGAPPAGLEVDKDRIWALGSKSDQWFVLPICEKC